MVTATTSGSLARGPCTERREASASVAWSAARATVIMASDMTRPATGRMRVSATAAMMMAGPAMVARARAGAGSGG